MVNSRPRKRGHVPPSRISVIAGRSGSASRIARIVSDPEGGYCATGDLPRSTPTMRSVFAISLSDSAVATPIHGNEGAACKPLDRRRRAGRLELLHCVVGRRWGRLNDSKVAVERRGTR